MISNNSPEVIELNKLAEAKNGRFYYSRCDERYRFLRGGLSRGEELHTFASITEARPWLTLLPSPSVYQGNGEALPGVVRRERVKGVEPDHFLRTVMSRVCASRH